MLLNNKVVLAYIPPRGRRKSKCNFRNATEIPRPKSAFPLGTVFPLVKDVTNAPAMQCYPKMQSPKRQIVSTDKDALYKSFRKIQQGGNGMIYEAIDRDTKERVVIKTKPEGSKSSAVVRTNEFRIQNMMDHPNIVRAHKILKCGSIVMEVLDGPDLFDLMVSDDYKVHDGKPAFEESTVRGLINQMMNALNYCHEMKVAHRDIKPENFVFKNVPASKDDVANTPLLLIDFGEAIHSSDITIDTYSTWINTDADSQITFTEGYVSPEQLLNGNRYSPICDMWSLGICLFQFYHKALPQNLIEDRITKGSSRLLLKNVSENIDRFFKIKYTGECCGHQECKVVEDKHQTDQKAVVLSNIAFCFLKRCLTFNPSKRITATEAINHPFLFD